jgi:predicted Zn-dependent protease
VRFVPKELNKNVNISAEPPLKEFFLLLIALLGIVLCIYIGLGFAVDLIVPRLPTEIETRLGRMYSRLYEGKKDEKSQAVEAEIQRILDGLAAELSYPQPYKVHLVSAQRANALALPGGNIIITSALIKEIDSENALAFVLAHELGHFANRDHLRGLGRGLVFVTISSILFGADSSVSQILQNSLQNVEMKFSQHQEKKADLFALALLNRRYGHIAGATDFFQSMKKKEKGGRFLYYFASHPHSQERINILEQEIVKMGYARKESIPLDRNLKP